MKTEKELLVESLVDLYREMDAQKEVSQISLSAESYIKTFNQLLAAAKKTYPDIPAIALIPETEPMQARGISQLPRLTSEAPPKFSDTKLKTKQILNALGEDPTGPRATRAQSQVVNQQREVVTRICDRFQLIAAQMLRRRNNRATLTITDEYDVQDLLHSLLVLFFDDVRREECTPSYAGGSSRMDILLKPETTVIEAKYNLVNKQVREQLAIDIAMYRAHPDCKTLICFVYDPNGRLENPKGVEADLGKLSTDELQVIVLVRP